jgi:hypothetical protein
MGFGKENVYFYGQFRKVSEPLLSTFSRPCFRVKIVIGTLESSLLSHIDEDITFSA